MQRTPDWLAALLCDRTWSLFLSAWAVLLVCAPKGPATLRARPTSGGLGLTSFECSELVKAVKNPKDPASLASAERCPPPLSSSSVPPPPGALLSTNEKSCFTVFPAFVNIWTASFLAHRMQSFARDHIADLGVLRSSLHGGANPRRFSFDGDCSIARLDAE